MKLLFLLVSIALTSPSFANTDLDFLEDVIRINHSGEKSRDVAPDSHGSLTLSQDKSLNEMMLSIETCRRADILRTSIEEGIDFTVVAYSCKTGKEIVVTETLVHADKSIGSFQEMKFQESSISPTDYYKLLSSSQIEKTSTDKDSSAGLKTLGTFARLGIPVLLSLKASKLLAPNRLDWQKHFIAGSLISGVTILTTQGILRFIAKKRGTQMSERKITIIASVAGLVLSMVAGAGKEFYDSRGHGTVEFRDAFFTAAGGAMVSMFFAIPFGRMWGAKATPVMMPYRAY